MTIDELKTHLDTKFERLEGRLSNLEKKEAFLSGVWKALATMGGISGVGVSVIAWYLKSRS